MSRKNKGEKKSSYELTTAKLLLATAILEAIEKILTIIKSIVEKLE